MKNSNQILKTLLTLSTLALLSACAGNRQAGSTDNSSRLPDAGSSSTKPVAFCNQAAGTETSAKLRVYTDATNTVQMNYVYTRLTALPAKFKTDESYIAMWKWMSSTGGATYLDNTPLNFMLLNPATGLAITNWKTTLRWSDVQAQATAMGISDAQTFFSKITILVDLKDSSGEYDVLRFSNYDLSTNKSISQTDALIPMFHADPADYALESNGTVRATALKNLHPFKAYTGQGYTATQFATMAKSFCF